MDMITPHFSVNEMKCKCCGVVDMDDRFMVMLEELRERTGRIGVNCGYRCKKHNAEIKGSVSNSWHTKGRACDCVPLDISLDDFAKIAKTIFREVIMHTTFVHVARE